MKKITLFFTVFILLCVVTDSFGKRRTSYTKRAAIGSIDFGARAIIGTSNIYGKFYEEPGKFRVATNLEVVGSWLFTKDIYLLTGVGYGYYGANMTNSNLSNPNIASETHGYKLHYVTIPIQVEFSLNKFFIAIGPQVNLLVAANDYYSIQTINNPNQSYFLLEPIKTLNKVDVGGRVTVGYKLGYGIKMELSYFNSFTDLTIHPSPNNDRVISTNYNTNAFIGLGLSYFINIKK